MKEEIEMEKLIELLNEYEGDTFVSIKWDEDHFKDDYFKNYERKIISKRYGFIGWLVENDKIELKAGPLYGFQPIMSNRQPFTLYETLLMLLSIQDNPIEFLVSILR